MTPRRLAAVLAAGVVLYAGAFALVLTNDLGDRRTLVLLVVATGIVFTLTGAVAAAHRPDNRTGTQMLLVGLAWALGSLQASETPALFTVGFLLGALAFVPFTWLILSYPTGKLPRADRPFVLAVAAIVTLGPLAVALTDPTPITGCTDCRESSLLAVESSGLARASSLAYALGAAAIALVAGLHLIRRYRAATPPLRRVVGPVYLITLEALAALIASGLVTTVSDTTALWLEHVALISLALVPIAFLAGILRTRLARARIAGLAIALADGMPLRDALADALGDPSLELAYWSAQREEWVDVEGRTLSDPIARGAHAATFVEHAGTRVAALLHDRTLTEEPELVDGVAATAGLAFEKERLQAELRAQYRFLETIIDTAPSLLTVVDLEGRLRNLNRAVERASGLARGAGLEGRHFWDVFIDPEERPAMIQRFHDAAPAHPAAEYENTFTNPLGEEHAIAWRSAPLHDEEGNVVRIIAGGIDITERRRREVELQRQRDFANAVADAIPSYILIVDHDAVVAPAGGNRAFLDAFGWTLDDLVGTSVLELVSPEDELATRMGIAGAANGVPQAERETRWLARDGTERVVAWTATPILDPRGAARVLVSGADVTERARQEEEVRASRSRIVAATDAARRRLERNLHDGAQQRLAALSLSLRLTESKLPVDVEAAIESLGAARSELAQALDELRELARGLHPNILTDRGVGPALESLVARSPLPVEVHVPVERFPPAIEAAAYYIAAEALANVVKYAQASSATVHIAPAEVGEAIVVEVVDDGVGGADPSLGSGLEGLVDRVESLDGSLEIESPRGHGTRIRAVIPAVRQPAVR